MEETTSDVGEEEEIYTAHFGGLFSLKGNADLKGPGKIIVNPAVKKVLFRAHRRAFLSNREMELSFGADDIDNVVVERNRVQFYTLKGRSGRARVPFVFWLKDHAQAADLGTTLQWDMPSDSAPPFAYGKRTTPTLQLPDALRKPYVLTALAVLLALGLGVGAVNYFGQGFWERFLFEKNARTYSSDEERTIQNFQSTLSSPMDDAGNGSVRHAADQVIAFYERWGDALDKVKPSNPELLSRKYELLAKIEKQTLATRREVARRTEITALHALSTELDAQVKTITGTKEGSLAKIQQRIEELETTTDEGQAAKADLLKQIENAAASIVPTASSQDVAALKLLEDEYQRGLDDCVKKIPREESAAAIDQTVSLLNQQMIPFLQDCAGRVERSPARDETSLQRRTTLLAEVNNNLERARRLVAQLTEKRTAQQLYELTNAFNQTNQTYANRAALIGRGPTKQDAIERIKLIKMEVLPFLAEAEKRIEAGRGETPKFQESYEQLQAAIDQKRGKWTDLLHDYEGVLSFLALSEEKEAEWKSRYGKLASLVKTKGNESAARKYITGELIPYNDQLIAQIDGLSYIGPAEELRLSTKENLQKRSAELREMAAQLGAPKKK